MSDPVEELVRQAQGRVGTTLNGKYRLERLLGMGGMAAVYEAVHRNGNRVAIKVVHRPLSVDAEVRSRFLQEGYAANNVDHPAVVRTLDDEVTEDGAIFLVMELLTGAALEDEWDTAPRLSPDRVLVLGFELCDVLAAAHEKGIVHRDLKPQNLFVTDEGRLKVLDFGLARMEAATAAHATKSGQVFGTPAYMPPEQALGRVTEIDHQSDLWAVGATLFTLLSGKFVHDANTSAEHLIYTATRPARSLGAVAPHLPRAIVEVVDRALAYDKGQRFPHARAMQEALERAYVATFGAPIPVGRHVPKGRMPAPSAAHGLPPFSTSVRGDSPTVQQGAPVRQSSLLVWGGVAAAFGMALSAAVLLFARDSSEPTGPAASGEMDEAPTKESSAERAASPVEDELPSVAPIRDVASDPAATSPSTSASTSASAGASASAEVGGLASAPPAVPSPRSGPTTPPPTKKKKRGNPFDHQ